MQEFTISREWEEVQVVECAQAGNQFAFATIVERYQQSVGGYLLRLVGDKETALDLTQETFVRGYIAIRKTRPGLLVRPWLYRIATNLATDHLRRQRRVRWLPLSVIAEYVGRSELADIEEREVVKEALMRVSVDERVVLILCGMEGMPYGEVGGLLGTSVEAVRKRFTRAKAHFGQIMDELTRKEQ